MVAAGAERGWRKQRPDITGHAGFRLNTLISPLANARWSKLVEEFLRAKRAGPAEMQVFVNTTLGRVWKQTIDEVEPEGLAARVEDFGLADGRFPREVLAISGGVDTQPDRFEVTLWGWSETQAFALGAFVIWGSPNDRSTQAELDALLRTIWLHPNGWRIGIDAVAVDSAGPNTQAVYDFCAPRFSRRIYAIVGRGGARRIWEPSKRRKSAVRLVIVGIDQLKTEFLQRLPLPAFNEDKQPTPGAIRLSRDLPEEWFEQVVGERRVVRYVHNRAVIEFRPRRAGQRVEALDTTVYAFAARYSLRINFQERRARTAGAKLERRSIASQLAGAGPHRDEPESLIRRR